MSGSSLEVLVTCDSKNTLWTCCVWDPHTGTSLMTYKGGGTAEARTLSFIGEDYLAAAEKIKPVLHVWPLNSHQTVQGMRFVLPGKCNALAVTRDGAYVAAGINEKIYLWQISSGKLLTIISRHYQKVLLLKFTPDGRYFVSAAEDGMVMVWMLATVSAHPEIDLVKQSSAGQHDPVYIFSDHSLPITDMCISKMGLHGRLFTISSDRTCKIYDLACGEMLLNLVFDNPLTSIALDVMELSVFIGTSEGKIYQQCLTNPPRNKELLVETSAEYPTFVFHGDAVTCLSVSLDGKTLMSGSHDELMVLWHIPSRQPLRTIRHKGSITNAFFTDNYPAFFKPEFTPSVILHSLERTLAKDSDEVTEIEVLTKRKIKFWPESNGDSEMSLDSKNIENEFKLKEAAVKEEMEKLKSINANLYAFSIRKELQSIPIVANKSSKKKKRKNRESL